MKTKTQKFDVTVKYDNYLNLILFKGMSKLDNNIFFAILSKLQNKGSEEIIIDGVEIKKIIGDTIHNNEVLKKNIRELAKKIASCLVEFETEKSYKYFTLFRTLEVLKGKEFSIIARISEDFVFLLNDIKSGFTIFEVYEFCNLRSKYSQILYRLLKQYKSTGLLSMEWSKFLEIMNIPEKNTMVDINKIIKSSVNELANLVSKNNMLPFENLTYVKTKTPGYGNKITGITFTFVAEKNKIKENNNIMLLNNKNNQVTNNLSAKIVNHIQKQNILNNVANNSNNKNYQNNSNNVVEKLQHYVGTPVKFHVINAESNNPQVSVCKIHSISLGLNSEMKIVIKVKLKNSDDGFISDFYEFENERHFSDWLKKNKA